MSNPMYLAVNGEVIGPYTGEQIYSMWSAGQIPATTLYYDEENGVWRDLLPAIESFKPLSSIQKLLVPPPPPTPQEKLAQERQGYEGCGCLFKGCSIIFFLCALVFLRVSFPHTVNEVDDMPTFRPQMAGEPYAVWKEKGYSYGSRTRQATKEELEVNMGMAWLSGIAAVLCLFSMKIFYWLARRKGRQLTQH